MPTRTLRAGIDAAITKVTTDAARADTTTMMPVTLTGVHVG